MTAVEPGRHDGSPPPRLGSHSVSCAGAVLRYTLRPLMKTSPPLVCLRLVRLGARVATFALLVAGGGLLSSCAHSYEVKVDSLAKPKAEDSISYEIHNANPEVSEDTLRYKEAVGFVRTALSGKGLYESPDPGKADLVVNVDYGVGPPQVRHETVSEPIYLTVPGNVYMETIQVGTDKSGRAIYTTVARQDPPTTEFAGFRDYVITTVVYEKHLKLSARENTPGTEGKPPTEIWTVDVTSEGESHDLRKALPVLAAATIDFVGKDSHGQKTIRLKDTDKDVAFVKAGM